MVKVWYLVMVLAGGNNGQSTVSILVPQSTQIDCVNTRNWELTQDPSRFTFIQCIQGVK